MHSAIDAVFPWVTFVCSRQNKSFGMPREHILHIEEFQEKDENGVMRIDPNLTYVVFVNPNPTKKTPLSAVVNMKLSDFMEDVIRPAYVPAQDTCNEFAN